MGCTYSGQNRGNEDGTRSFRVHNVDDQGMELNRGVIEIRDHDLVLYQKGKEPIRWPLRCLRRYGFDAELFSFESGRRCVMGPGIYAFKCAHAEELFKLVQESIQRAGLEDQRGQQFNHNHTVNVSQHSTGRQTTQQAASENLTQEHPPNNTYRSGTEQPHNGQAGSQMYVNGAVVSEAGHEYVNSNITRPISGAFQIDETAALIDFLHHPPGVADTGNSQVNYAELCMPDPHLSQSSLDNLLEETGQDNVSRTAATHRLSQHSLLSGGVRVLTENNRISMPNDILAGASQDSDSVLQSADSDVFLTDVPQEEGGHACLNYVNLALEEGGGAASASAPAPQEILLPPSHEIVSNYANLTLHGHRVHRPFKQVNYIVIDHKSQAACGESGTSGTGNPGNNSPTSPISCMSIPESPCRKTESYAMIDFDRTVALSSVTRATEDAGSRKTRHNSTISDMP